MVLKVDFRLILGVTENKILSLCFLVATFHHFKCVVENGFQPCAGYKNNPSTLSEKELSPEANLLNDIFGWALYRGIL